MKSTLSRIYRTMFDPSAHIGRLPFILVHIVVLALLYFFVQVFQYFIAVRFGRAYEIGQIEMTLSIFVLTVLLLPVYIRRAHDLGWKMRSIALFALLPAFLRICLIGIPFIGLLSRSALSLLLVLMPYIGLAFWALTQIELFFFVILAGAPSVRVHSAEDSKGRSFTLKKLYGFSIFKSEKYVKEKTQKE